MNSHIKTQFIEYFFNGIKPQTNLRIGVEQEKFLFDKKTKKRISYETVKKIFNNLKKYNWTPIFEKENIIGLKRGKQQITTEPGLQCELSGEPLSNIHEVCRESSKYLTEIKEATKNLDLISAPVGFDPYNVIEQIPKNPKERYEIMTKEMPKGGELSLDMMYRTCGIQINYDYTSEKNFEKIFKLGNYLVPLTIAMFANSPFKEGKLNGYFSFRNKVWQKTSRAGIMPIAFEKITFEKYFDHVIKYPILFAIDKKKYIKPNGQTFKDFIEGKFKNLKKIASLKDFENHLSTIFTEVRLKKYIEVRSLDTCDWGCVCNGPAFFTGLFYGEIDEACEIIKKWKKDDVMNTYLEAPEQGLDSELKGKKLYEWAKIFLKISHQGLIKRKKLNDTNKDETIYLKQIEDLVYKKTNRAQLLINKFKSDGNLTFLENEKENFSYSGF